MVSWEGRIVSSPPPPRNIRERNASRFNERKIGGDRWRRTFFRMRGIDRALCLSVLAQTAPHPNLRRASFAGLDPAPAFARGRFRRTRQRGEEQPAFL